MENTILIGIVLYRSPPSIVVDRVVVVDTSFFSLSRQHCFIDFIDDEVNAPSKQVKTSLHPKLSTPNTLRCIVDGRPFFFAPL